MPPLSLASLLCGLLALLLTGACGGARAELQFLTGSSSSSAAAPAKFDLTRLGFCGANQAVDPQRPLVAVVAQPFDGCGGGFGAFLDRVVASDLARDNASLIIVMGGRKFLEPCTLEARVRALEDHGGVAGAVFVGDKAGEHLITWRLPYDGSFIEESTSHIPAGFADRSILDGFAALNMTDGAGEPFLADTANFSSFVLDEDTSLDALASPVAVVLFVVGQLIAVPAVITAVTSLHRRHQKRRTVLVASKRARRRNSDKFGVRDMLYIGQMVNFFLVVCFASSIVAVNQLRDYPQGLVGAGGWMMWLQSIGMFVAAPVNNCCFMLVVLTWIDSMEFSSAAKGQDQLFNSRGLQQVFIAANVASFLLECVHVPVYLNRLPLDAWLGMLTNFVTLVMALLQCLGFLFYGRRVIHALARGGASKNKNSPGDVDFSNRTTLSPMAMRMFKLIRNLSGVMMLGFFTGFILIAKNLAGGRTVAGDAYFFLIPQTYLRSCMIILYVSIVTPPKKKALIRPGEESTASTTGLASNNEKASSSVVESVALESAALETEEEGEGGEGDHYESSTIIATTNIDSSRDSQTVPLTSTTSTL